MTRLLFSQSSLGLASSLSPPLLMMVTVAVTFTSITASIGMMMATGIVRDRGGDDDHEGDDAVGDDCGGAGDGDTDVKPSALSPS